MRQEEEISHRPEEGDKDSQADVDAHAARVQDDGQEEVDRVQEQGDQTGDQEDMVPFCHQRAGWFVNSVPPCLFSRQCEALGEVAEPRRGVHL